MNPHRRTFLQTLLAGGSLLATWAMSRLAAQTGRTTGRAAVRSEDTGSIRATSAGPCVTYAATGLPPGLSLNPSTGVVCATVTSAGVVERT